MIGIVLAAALALNGPCALATPSEVERVLGSSAAPVGADEVGEETAPYCLWTNARRDVAVKVVVWSADELPVLGISDAEDYYRRLEADAARGGAPTMLEGLGERAFETGRMPETALPRDGMVVILKNQQVIVFDFEHVVPAKARAFAKQVTSRL